MQTLIAWQNDADLAGIRDVAALGKLPANERKEWHALWARLAEVWSVVPQLVALRFLCRSRLRSDRSRTGRRTAPPPS